MKKILKQIFLVIPAMVIAFGCGDEFLDQPPEFAINSENYFNSEADYRRALVASYDLLTAVGYLTTITSEIASDNANAGGESATDVVAWQEINAMSHTPVNDQLQNIWNWNYAGINRCNYIFEFQDKTDFEGKEVVLAENAFLRAFYYFQLVKFFGDVPMPIGRRVNFGEASGFPQLPASQVYDQMEADLTFAAENLPDVQPEPGRATRGAAFALLGKVHLYQEEYSEAVTALTEVINGPYDLFSDYSTLFLQQNENSIESVFEIQYTNVQGAGFECLQCSEGNVMVGFSGIRGYDGPIYRSGFSFNVVREGMANAFEAGDLRQRPSVLDIEQFISEQADPNAITFVEGHDHTGFYQGKYQPRQGEAFQDPNLTNLTNIRWIRFSDVLLMAAEALNRGSIDDNLALTYVNRVRERAGLDPISVTGSALTDAIYQERRVELVGEGHRFFDLVRTGRAAANIEGFTPGKNEVFPIPSIEIELAGNVWEQNDGY
jgi:hypothetical protein